MKIKSLHWIILFGAALALLSCKKESEVETPAEGEEYVTISASLDTGGSTKTYLDGVQVKWEASDSIAVWFGTLNTAMDNTEYKVASIDGEDARQATFQGFAVDSPDYMAVYPYIASKDCSKQGKMTVALPTVQPATAGGFAKNVNVAVAYSKTTNLTFQNVGGLMAVTLASTGGHTVKAMRLTGTSALSGKVEIEKASIEAGTPVASVTDGVDYVELTGSFTEGNTYYFVVLPGDHTGFIITLYDDNRYITTATSTHAYTITRNSNTLIANLTVPVESWARIPSEEKVVLNEIDCNAKRIELYNYGTTDEYLDDWALYKDGGAEAIWSGTTEIIPAGGYLVLNKGNDPGAGIFTSGISPKKNLKLELKNASGTSKDIFTRGEEGAGWGKITLPENTKNSFSRVPDGDEGIWKYAAPTIGETNGGQTGTIEQYAMVKDVLILNELNGNKNQKFIELRNVSGASYSLEGVTLHKDGKLVWTGVANLSVATDGYVLLYSTDVTKTGGAHEGYDARLAFDSGLSASKAVNVQLFNAAGAPLDIFNYATYSGTPAPASYGRNADGVWYYQDATPGAANTDGTAAVTGLE